MATIKKTKFGFKRYFEPTPKRIRIFGDSLATASLLAASISVLNGNPVVGTIMLVAGWAGKFISNFFTEVSDDQPEIIETADNTETAQPEKSESTPNP